MLAEYLLYHSVNTCQIVKNTNQEINSLITIFAGYLVVAVLNDCNEGNKIRMMPVAYLIA